MSIVEAESTPEQIQHDIEATRSDMTRKLEALERKLAPRQLVGEVADSVLKAVAGPETGIAPMIDLVRRHPLPAALIGVGAGWLLFSAAARGDAEDSAAVGSAAETATRLAGAGRPDTIDARGRRWDRFARNPVALGTAGLLLGAAAAYLLPLTEREAAWFASARRDLDRTVRSTGEAVKATAGEAAAAAAQAALDAAEGVVESHLGSNGSKPARPG